MTRLHLGCGKRYIPGFIHIDLDAFDHVDYRVSIDRLPMFGDDSVDEIYCCHAFQYFDRTEAAGVLAEWRRVLRPNGVLRLSVPDVRSLIAVYQTTGELGRMLGPLYGKIPVETADGEMYFYHRTTYDLVSMTTLLESTGFHGVREYDWRTTSHRDYDDYSQAYFPHMDREHGVQISLNVEANK